MENYLFQRNKLYFLSALIKITLLLVLLFMPKAIFIIVSTIIILEIIVISISEIKAKNYRETKLVESAKPIEDSVPQDVYDSLVIETNKLTEKNREYQEIIEKLYSNYKYRTFSLDTTEKISQKGISKVQDKVNIMTNDIFSLIDNSQVISSDINKLILSVTEGDSSLYKVIDLLSGNIEKIDSVVNTINDVNLTSATDSKDISEIFLKVKNFTRNITNLAEQTRVLAINASVEAARSGVYGKGFAVIAGEIRKLADNSKVFAETINGMINDSYHAMNKTFSKQKNQLSNISSQLINTQNDIKNIAYSLEPKIEVLTDSIRKSSVTSSNLTDRLNNFTHSIQFLDLVRQIMDHINIIQREALEDCAKDFNEKSFNTDLEKIKENALQSATKHFTVKEEWEALGIKINETMKCSTNNNLDGDVTLF